MAQIQKRQSCMGGGEEKGRSGGYSYKVENRSERSVRRGSVVEDGVSKSESLPRLRLMLLFLCRRALCSSSTLHWKERDEKRADGVGGVIVRTSGGRE